MLRFNFIALWTMNDKESAIFILIVAFMVTPAVLLVA
jgi:hypothetical protein